MATHDLIQAERPAGRMDRLTLAIWVGTIAVMVLGAAAFAVFPMVRLNYFHAYEAMYESMVAMSIICR